MRVPVVLATIATLTWAAPDGFFHQQYQYKQSSSSYKNNELQHKNEDEGYYSKHGNLDSNTEPKVNSFSQHVAYTNPRLQNKPANNFGQWEDYGSSRYTTNDYSQQGEDFGSGLGRLTSNNRYLQHGFGGNANFDENVRSNQYSQSSSYSVSGQSGSLIGAPLPSGNNYQASSYNTHSNLRDVTRKLEQELSEQLRRAISQRGSSYTVGGPTVNSAQVESDFYNLQGELKRNLSRQLQQELKNQYGIEGKRGAFSYSVTATGGFAPKPNYDNRELVDLTQQLENNLQQQLQNTYQTQYRYSSGSQLSRQGSHVDNFQNPDAETFNDRSRVTNFNHRTHTRTESGHSSGSSNLTPIDTITVNPMVPLRQIITIVQNDLDRSLSAAFLRITTYSNGRDSYQSVLNQLTNDLNRNLTLKLDKELQKYYGTQEQIGTYSFSLSKYPTANYNVEDLEIYKQQVKDNLLNKLNQLMRTYQKSSSRTESYHSSSSATSSQHGGSYVHYREPEIHITNIKSQVETDLGRLLDNEIHNQRAKYLTSGNRQVNFETLMFQLTTDLKQNLTEKLNSKIQEANRKQHGLGRNSVSYRTEDLQDLRQQIEDDLLRKLTEKIRTFKTEYSSRQTTNINYGSRPYRPGSLDSQNFESSQRGHGYQVHETSSYPSQVRPTTSGRQNYQYRQGSTSAFHSQQQTDENEDFANNYSSQNNQDNYNYNERTAVYQQTERRPVEVGRVPVTIPSGASSFQIIGTTNANNSAALLELTRQLQEDLSGQLQRALNKKQTNLQSQVIITGQQGGDNRVILQELTEELKRNLTEKLQQTLREKYGNQATRGGYSYTVSTSGTYYPKANYNKQQLDDLMRQLEQNLEKQLQESLNQQSSRHYSYSSSSGFSQQPSVTHSNSYSRGSNQRAYTNDRYFAPSSSSHSSKHGSMKSFSLTTNTEDCEEMQGDDGTVQQIQIAGGKNLEGPAAHGHFYQENNDESSQQHEEIGQLVEELGQQLNSEYGSVEYGQQNQDSNYQQTTSNEQQNQSNEFENMQFGGQTQESKEDFNGQMVTGQQHTDSDEFGQVVFGSQSQDSKEDVNQQITSNVQQQTNSDEFDQIAFGNQNQESNQQTVTQQSKNLNQQESKVLKQENASSEEVNSSELLEKIDKKFELSRLVNQFINQNFPQQTVTEKSVLIDQKNKNKSKNIDESNASIESKNNKLISVIEQKVVNQQNKQSLSQQTEIVKEQTQDQETQQKSEDFGQVASDSQVEDSNENLFQQSDTGFGKIEGIDQTSDNGFEQILLDNINQKFEDKQEHVEDLTQQSNLGQEHVEDLTQQSDLGQEHVEDLTQQSDLGQEHLEDVISQSENKGAQSQEAFQDFGQLQVVDKSKDEKDFGQILLDTNQKSEDKQEQEEDLTQQSDLGQKHVDVLTQQSDLGQEHLEDITQQSENIDAQFQEAFKDFGQLEVDKSKDVQKQDNIFGQEHIDLTHQSESHEELTQQQKNDGFQILVSHKNSSKSNNSAQHSHSYQASGSQHSHRQHHVYSSSSSSSSSHSSFSQSSSSHEVSGTLYSQNLLASQKLVTSTTEEPSFWGQVGSKLSNTYTSAKDKAKSLFSSSK